MSLGIGNSVVVFTQWDQRGNKGDVVVKHVGFLSFKNYSLIIGLGKTCCCCAT
jgi:hypothetical protein